MHVMIKVGSKVKIAKSSRYYDIRNRHYNPHDTIGKVINISTVPNATLLIQVDWLQGYRNDYTLADLELVEETKPMNTATTEPKRHKPKAWVFEAHKMTKAGKSSLEIAGELCIPDRTIRHNLQVHAELLNRFGSVEPKELPGLQQTRKPTIFVIPDTQVKGGISLDYIHWIGSYIKRKKPDIIVMIGDWYDMEALSTYDKGQLSAEGKRVKKDIEAGDKAVEILESYIDYKPRKVITLGNHEERIDRFVNYNPAFEGFIGTDKLAFHKYGWEVAKFLQPVNICGINFVHYLQNPMTGKPLGGTALNRLKAVGESFVMGHQQTYDFCQRPLQLSGNHQIGLIVGACYHHDENYKGVQGNHHFRGCVMLYECANGYAMHKAITLQHMKEVYERGNV